MAGMTLEEALLEILKSIPPEERSFELSKALENENFALPPCGCPWCQDIRDQRRAHQSKQG